MDFSARNTRGLFARGTPDECPPDRLLQATNLISKGPVLIPRPGYENSNLGVNRPFQSHLSVFQPLPVAGVIAPKVISQDSFLVGGKYRLYDTSDALPIHIYAADEPYHSWINFYGRGYFTLHDTIIGSQNEKVQVFEDGAASRDAAGLKPVSLMAGVLSGTPGNLGVGTYLIDVAYVTSSGFITRPSGTPINVDTFGSASIDLTVIPTGPASTAKRQIVATKAITLGTYTGNPNDYEFFIVPNALIADNVTTTHNLSFFDGNLIDTADILLDLLETIPCGVGIGEFNNRMIVWGEYANNSIVRLSYPGEPESFHATSGIIVVDPTESGGVTNCIGFNNQLYITKGTRVFIATDNGGDPSTWPVLLFDGGIGSETYGASQVLDSKGKHLNQFLIASRQGLFLFDGVVRTPELTFWVEDIWKDIDPTKFSKVQIFQNPFANQIYCLLPRNLGIYNILVGDYSEGLNPDTIKWFLWNAPVNNVNTIYSLVIVTNADNSIVVYLADDNLISKFTPLNPVAADYAVVFNCTLQTPPLITDPDSQLQQINTVRMRQIGAGVGHVSVVGLTANFDPAKVTPTYVMPFINNTAIMQDEVIYVPFVDEQPTVKFTIVSTNRPKISRVWINGDFYGEEKP